MRAADDEAYGRSALRHVFDMCREILGGHQLALNRKRNDMRPRRYSGAYSLCLVLKCRVDVTLRGIVGKSRFLKLAKLDLGKRTEAFYVFRNSIAEIALLDITEDYEFDINEGKATIANRFDSQLDSLIVLKIFLILAYASPILLCIFDILDWQIFIIYLTLPLAFDLYKSMYSFSLDSEDLPRKKWYHFPMENLEDFIKRNEGAFMMRMLQARNLMIYFSLFLTIAIIICKII